MIEFKYTITDNPEAALQEVVDAENAKRWENYNSEIAKKEAEYANLEAKYNSDIEAGYEPDPLPDKEEYIYIPEPELLTADNQVKLDFENYLAGMEEEMEKEKAGREKAAKDAEMKAITDALAAADQATIDEVKKILEIV